MPRVLLIDDSPDFRAWARCTLEREGLEVIEARDALAGLQRAVEDAPDCVLVSDTLAGLDGFDVTQRIASEVATSELPLLVCCDHADPELRRDAKEAGAQGLLPRTYREADFVGPIRDALWSAGARWIAETR